MGLDHHCWYISSCVGAGNLRHFILLLACVVAGTSYGLALGAALGWRQRAALVAHTRASIAGLARFHPALRLLVFALWWLLTAPPRLALWAFFTGGERCSLPY